MECGLLYGMRLFYVISDFVFYVGSCMLCGLLYVFRTVVRFQVCCVVCGLSYGMLPVACY